MIGNVVAIVLAAGESRRMGVPKMGLPWGDRTVIGQVVSVVKQAGVNEILVVTGGAQAIVRQALLGERVKFVHNDRFSAGGMLSSVQAGIASAWAGDAGAGLIVLGDQPQIQVEVIRQLLQRWNEVGAQIVVPSYRMRRGHPWLVVRSLWQEILDLPSTGTLRQFLNANNHLICHLMVETESILQDLDTPDEYERQKPPK